MNKTMAEQGALKGAKSKNIKIGIYLAAILMMGVIGVSSSLSTIAARFPEYDMTMIQNIISIPCLVVIPVTLITGKLMDVVSKKTLTIIGILIFLIGGITPAFMDNFIMILVMRGIFGVGLGLLQVLCTALVAENYEGAQRDKVQGQMTSFQMLGCAVMVFVGGWLGSISWNLVFLVYLISIISLIGVIIFIPHRKPVRAAATTNSVKPKIKITGAAWGWIILMFVFFIGGQIYSNAVSFLVTNLEIGTAAEAGMSLAFFAIGGFVMGLIFGKIAGKAKKATLAIGFLILAVSYLLMAFGMSMGAIYAGSFICGLAFSICMPCLFVGAANSVDPLSAGMAIAIATCSQNFSMFMQPYIVNPIAEGLSASNGLDVNQMSLAFGAGLIGIIGVIALIWGIVKNISVAKKAVLAEQNE